MVVPYIATDFTKHIEKFKSLQTLIFYLCTKTQKEITKGIAIVFLPSFYKFDSQKKFSF